MKVGAPMPSLESVIAVLLDSNWTESVNIVNLSTV